MEALTRLCAHTPQLHILRSVARKVPPRLFLDFGGNENSNILVRTAQSQIVTGRSSTWMSYLFNHEWDLPLWGQGTHALIPFRAYMNGLKARRPL